MFYVKNLPRWERVSRVVASVGIGAAALAEWPGMTGWLVAGSAAGILLTGLVGFCPMCAMVGRRPPDRP